MPYQPARTRSGRAPTGASKKAMLRELGAVPVVADALDPRSGAEAVGKAKPEVIVHQLTALAGAPGEEQFELVRRRKFPLVADGGVWSFIHVADAAEAAVAAVEHGTRGVYNVVDDDPGPVAEWLPALTRPLRRRTLVARTLIDSVLVRLP